MKKTLLSIFLLAITFSYGQQSGEVIITEIYNRPQKPTQTQLDAAIAAGGITSNTTPNEGHTEWFEVYNTTSAPVVMDGWTLEDESSSSNVTTIGSFTIGVGEYAIFSGFSIPEAQGLTATDQFEDYVYDYKKPSFNNESSYSDVGDSACPDGITIKKADGTVVDTVEYDYGYTVSSCADAITTDHDFPAQGGNSRTAVQLDNNFLNATDNDNPLFWSFTDSANVYDTINSQKGTPGTANDSDPSLSISNFNAFQGLSIYPNPVKSILTIKSSTQLEISSIEIFNILGANVLTVETLTNDAINVSEMAKGVYLVKINSGVNTITKKLVIE